jgi:hypothetical protein
VDSDHRTDHDVSGGSDSGTSDTNLSLRSWFGSVQEDSPEDLADLAPTFRRARADSDSSTDHSWLPDTEEMFRTREFLAAPAPQFHHSTDSDTDSNGVGGGV